jgi:hypothetical protein
MEENAVDVALVTGHLLQFGAIARFPEANEAIVTAARQK